MDIRKVKKLIELVESSDVAEIKISDDEGNIRITRCSADRRTASHSNKATPQPTAQSKTYDDDVKTIDLGNDVDNFSGIIIRSPMVGTFYAASSPGQAAFVEIGTTISPDQTLCIIEAMKVMNQITCEHSGKVVKIFVQNTQPVEYNQPLFGIE